MVPLTETALTFSEKHGTASFLHTAFDYKIVKATSKANASHSDLTATRECNKSSTYIKH